MGMAAQVISWPMSAGTGAGAGSSLNRQLQEEADSAVGIEAFQMGLSRMRHFRAHSLSPAHLLHREARGQQGSISSRH